MEADPDPLMRWALAAIEARDRSVGVVVAADGHLVAFTRGQGPPEDPWGGGRSSGHGHGAATEVGNDRASGGHGAADHPCPVLAGV